MLSHSILPGHSRCPSVSLRSVYSMSIFTVPQPRTVSALRMRWLVQKVGGGHGSGSLHKEDKGTSARGTSRGHLGKVSVILCLRDGVIIKRHRQPKGISRWPQDMFIPKRDKRRSRKRSQRENTHFGALVFPICSYFTQCFQTSWPRFPGPEAGRHQLPLETVYKVLWQLPVSRAIGHGFRSLWVQLPWNPAFLASS